MGKLPGVPSGPVDCQSACLVQPVISIPSPKEEFGFNIGDDYRLVNYTWFEAYRKTLASEFDRLRLNDIGVTAEGRHQW